MEHWAALLNLLPREMVAIVSLLVIIEIMAITGATALNRLGASDHPLYQWIIWLIALPPIGVVYVMTTYYVAFPLFDLLSELFSGP